MDNRSEHFVARAIVKEVEKRKIKLSAVTNFIRLPGKGVSGDIADKKIMVGGENILKKNIPKILQTGTTIVYILENNKLQGAITLSDKIRAESFEAIQELKQMGIKVVMITGDSEDVAKTVANALNIDEYFARVLPKEKSEKIKSLQTQGRKTAMVGDGINDAPALIQADLGIAIGAGANVAVESAGIILAKNDPRDIAKIIRLSRATYVKMIQNLFWATGYNVIAIPLAAGALISQGIILSPAVSAILMSASTIIVAFNATLLRSKE